MPFSSPPSSLLVQGLTCLPAGWHQSWTTILPHSQGSQDLALPNIRLGQDPGHPGSPNQPTWGLTPPTSGSAPASGSPLTQRPANPGPNLPTSQLAPALGHFEPCNQSSCDPGHQQAAANQIGSQSYLQVCPQ